MRLKASHKLHTRSHFVFATGTALNNQPAYQKMAVQLIRKVISQVDKEVGNIVTVVGTEVAIMNGHHFEMKSSCDYAFPFLCSFYIILTPCVLNI
jgi:hypothetical protein